MQWSKKRLYRRAITTLSLVFLINLLLSTVTMAEPNFVSSNFELKWQRADKAVAEGLANPARSWVWGPDGFGPPAASEVYTESPGGSRPVQYFDKARMELNNPASGVVSNGLLVRELISGRMATGDAAFVQRQVAADIAVAGDPDNNIGPTYASFSRIASLNNDNPAPQRIGEATSETIDRAGRTGTSAELGKLTRYTYYDANLKHNIPEVFWYFLNQRGNIYQNGQYRANQTVLGEASAAPWLDTLGLPITEAYWSKVTVGGQTKDVLIQAFERRLLTYTPTNDAAFRVEMGNVGRHYFNWRYNPRYDYGVGPVAFGGVNLAGAEFAPTLLPGRYGLDYVYPNHTEIDYFVSKKLNVFRLPLTWERLQTGLFSSLDTEQLSRLDDVVEYATTKGANVILDLHNYARYYGKTIGQSEVTPAAFADFWGRLATRYKDNRRVMLGLMNEPSGIATQTWVDSANAAIQAIRNAGADNLVLVAGSSTTNAYSWNQTWHNTPYGATMLGINDPTRNYVYEFHQYLDKDLSGTSENCVSPTIGSERLQDFTAWLKQNGQRGFLGEFGGARNTNCYAALDDMLSYLDRNNDVWQGWTYWAAGPLWGDYIYTLEPLNGTDRPQLTVLGKHLGGSGLIALPPVAQPGPTAAPATPAPSPTPPPVVPAAAPGSFGVQYIVSSHWETGYNISVTIANNSASPVLGWTISWQLAHGETLQSNWNANCNVSGTTITCSSMSYNAELTAGGGSQNFGAQFVTKADQYSQPTSFTVNTITVTAR